MPTAPDLTQLNLNLLRSFCAIADERGISSAARRLSLSQPSLSLALRRLEESLGCRLVHRDSRRFVLTIEGERVHQECAEILRHVDCIAAMAAGGGVGEGGELRLAIISRLNSSLIDEAFRLYHQRHPAVRWRVDVQNSAETARRIQREKSGIGICLLAKPIIALTCRHLFREAFGIYCGSEHHMFGAAAVDLGALVHEPFVAFTCATEGMGLEPMAMLREGLGLGRRTIGESHDMEEVARMIAAGLGIGILPEAPAAIAVAAGRLWQLNLIDQPLGADVFLVHAGEQTLTRPERVFVELIDELARTCPDLA